MTAVIAPLRMLGVAGAAERPVLIAAGEQLVTAISAASGGECRIELAFAPCGGGLPVDADLVVISLLGEVASPDPIAVVAARWHAWLSGIAGTDSPHVVIGTIYRYVADRGERGVVIERIRLLNDLAIALSRTHGVEVADIDRAFALVGSAVVGSDYRCAGPDAARFAGHVIASAMLAGDLSPQLPAALGERARASHGTRDDLLDRHRQDAP